MKVFCSSRWAHWTRDSHWNHLLQNSSLLWHTALNQTVIYSPCNHEDSSIVKKKTFRIKSDEMYLRCRPCKAQWDPQGRLDGFCEGGLMVNLQESSKVSVTQSTLSHRENEEHKEAGVEFSCKVRSPCFLLTGCSFPCYHFSYLFTVVYYLFWEFLQPTFLILE